jgi:hypothetical protein
MLTDGGPQAPQRLTVAGDGGESPSEEEEEEEARWQEEAKKLQRGEPSDLDLDGVADYFSEPLPDGGRMEWADLDGDGQAESVLLRDADGNEREESDANEDGIIEKVRVLTKGPPGQLTVTEDTDWDGRLDKRTTVTFGETSRHVKVESDPDGDGVFTLVSEEEQPPYMYQGAPTACDEMADFPKNDLGPPMRVIAESSNGQPRVFVPVDGQHKGRCSPERANKLAETFSCARKKNIGCIRKTNQDLFKEVARAMGLATVAMACGNPCQGRPAVTTDSRQAINFNTTVLDALDETATCAMVLHEFLHVAGLGYDRKTHDPGIDRTYSCARYCTGCTRVPSPAITPWPTPNQECTRCAGTPDEKRQCGYKEKFENVACEPSYTWCHNGFDNYPCDTCQGTRQYECDDTRLPDSPTNLCCLTCPPGSEDSRTDVKCTGTSPALKNTCSQKTAFCQ